MRSLLRRMSHGSINSGDNTHVIRSPHPDVDVDGFKNTPLPHYVMKDFHKYHSKIAMVSTNNNAALDYSLNACMHNSS